MVKKAPSEREDEPDKDKWCPVKEMSLQETCSDLHLLFIMSW